MEKFPQLSSVAKCIIIIIIWLIHEAYNDAVGSDSGSDPFLF